MGKGQALSCFLAGLKHDMEIMVRMFNPKTLQEAYSLAKLQEALKNEPEMVSYTRVKRTSNKPVGGFGNLHSSKLSSFGDSGVNMETNRAIFFPTTGKRPLNLTP